LGIFPARTATSPRPSGPAQPRLESRHPSPPGLRTQSVKTAVETLVQRSARLDLEGVEFPVFSERPLDASNLRCLRYMHDVEHHTMCYLRDVLVTNAHADPQITAFLAAWCYEEHWHGDAIARVLQAHGELAGNDRVAVMRRGLSRVDRFRPLLYILGSAITKHMVTVHMTWGAINEWTTQAGYGRLAAKADHPILTELLKRIMKQEGRHIDFYASEATRRLDGHPGAQRMTRWALQRFWSPVGAGVMPRAEVQFLARHLFGGPEGLAAVRRIDRQIDRLPGLAGMRLVERALATPSCGRVAVTI
jgi:hypothetical protein